MTDASYFRKEQTTDARKVLPVTVDRENFALSNTAAVWYTRLSLIFCQQTGIFAKYFLCSGIPVAFVCSFRFSTIPPLPAFL